MPLFMLNLRKTFWKENVYSAHHRWDVDVPVWTNIFAIWNPINSGKIINLLQIDVGASQITNFSILSQIVEFSSFGSGDVDLTPDIVKYDKDSPNSIAKIFRAGSLILGKTIDRRTIGLDNGMPSYNKTFLQEYEILPNSGICIVHEAESASRVYNPWATFTWYE